MARSINNAAHNLQPPGMSKEIVRAHCDVNLTVIGNDKGGKTTPRPTNPSPCRVCNSLVDRHPRMPRENIMVIPLSSARAMRAGLAAFAVVGAVAVLSQMPAAVPELQHQPNRGAASAKLKGELDRAERLGAACQAGESNACALVYGEIDRLAGKFDVLKTADSTPAAVFEIMSRLDALQTWRLGRVSTTDAARQYRLWAQGDAARGARAAARAHLQKANEIERAVLASH
jgi:hypothetical protein